MSLPRVAVLGHVVPTPTAIPAGANPRQLGAMLKLYNYTRVLTPDNRLVDHVAYLRDSLGRPKDAEFSVWEMHLCASLLLKSHLERHGAPTLMVNYVDSDNQDAAFKRIQAFKPDVLVLSTTFILSTKHLADAGSLIRKYLPDVFVVAGGHHIFTTLMYMNPEEKRQYLVSSKLDAFVDDVQGEQTLLSLVQGWQGGLAKIPNLIWKDRSTGEVAINPRSVENNDVNSTPIDFAQVEPGSVVHIRTARSCSFKCSFCSYPTIAGDLALMEVETAVDTVRRAKEAGASALFFVDDTFNVPRPRFEKLIDRLIEENIGLPWYSFLRCQFVDGDLVKKMRKSGCQGVFLGIESGSDRILKNMTKGSASKYYGPGIGWLKDAGITTVGAFVVGFPGETAESVEETRSFIETSGLDFYFLQPFYYLHHTPIHKNAAQYQLRGQGLNWSHETMNSREALQILDRLFLEIKGPTFVNPDYTLWEIAYLRSKGLDMPAILKYRRTINQMTAAQMRAHGAPPGGVTSRNS
ncbi:MAG TPA: radical SAM protein [Elusimicrobiota bacterium]|nr:radical SAM protein [Elusimicrobiota bacterium]